MGLWCYLRVGELKAGDGEEDFTDCDDKVLRNQPQHVHRVLVGQLECLDRPRFGTRFGNRNRVNTTLKQLNGPHLRRLACARIFVQINPGTSSGKRLNEITKKLGPIQCSFCLLRTGSSQTWTPAGRSNFSIKHMKIDDNQEKTINIHFRRDLKWKNIC